MEIIIALGIWAILVVLGLLIIKASLRRVSDALEDDQERVRDRLSRYVKEVYNNVGR